MRDGIHSQIRKFNSHLELLLSVIYIKIYLRQQNEHQQRKEQPLGGSLSEQAA